MAGVSPSRCLKAGSGGEFPIFRLTRVLEVLPQTAGKYPGARRCQVRAIRAGTFHPSLGLKQKGEVWTIDVGRSYRAIAYRSGGEFHWFWIGSHEACNKFPRRVK